MPIQNDLKKLLKKNPFEYYVILQERFQHHQYSSLTPMPELKGEVDQLILNLHHPFIDDLIAHEKKTDAFGGEQSALELLRDTCETDLRSVLLKQTLDDHPDMVNYPYPPIAPDRLPYAPTIAAISKTLDFFDIIERKTKNNIISKYHSMRYTHYEQQLPHHLHSGITIPFSGVLTLLDLIRLRSVPFWVSGIAHQSAFADAFFNTPKEFYVHDANHNRRFKGYNELYFKMNHITSEEAKYNAYKRFSETIEEVIIPTFKINKNDSPEEKLVKLTLKTFYFEFLHEYAFPPDRDFFIQALKFRCGDPSPFEVYVNSEDTKKPFIRQEISNNRLSTHNPSSGFDLKKRYDPKQSVDVLLYHDEAYPHILTTLYGKLSTDFYDSEFYRIKDIPPKHERKAELVLEAVKRVLNAFHISPEEIGLTPENFDESLLELITNKRKDGSQLGPVNTYANELKKPTLKTTVVEHAILPKRKEELLQKERYKFFSRNQTNDDLATVSRAVHLERSIFS